MIRASGPLADPHAEESTQNAGQWNSYGRHPIHTFDGNRTRKALNAHKSRTDRPRAVTRILQ
jgi:hypothetical protein